MISRVLPLAGVTAAVFILVGCVGIPTESTESSSSSTASTERSSSDGASRSTADAKRSETSSQTVAAAKSDSDGPRSSWRSDRENQRETRPAAGGSNPDNAKLIEQLNDASRELATLRAANAKLRAERSQPATATTAAAKSDPADEKLAGLKSFAQFKQEVATLFVEMERMRKEHAGLNSSLKAAVEQADQARVAMARLESELRSEKRTRVEAEQVAAQLRDQLRSIARALSSAGLSVDKLSAAEPAKR